MGTQRKGQKTVTADSAIQNILQDWPQNPRNSAGQLLNYYGEPDEYSSSQLIWYNTEDGWKRTILSNKEIPHDFPAHHTDFLEQTIDYKVPIEMFSKLAEYDGSIIADRTKGELTAHCGSTSMNFIAINLAHDIVTGEKSVKEAREEFTYLYKSLRDGKKLPYAKTFQFDLPKANTADRDNTTL